MSDLNFASKVFRNDTDSAIWVRVGEFSVNEVGAYFDMRFAGIAGGKSPSERHSTKDDVYVSIQNRANTTETVAWDGAIDESVITNVIYQQPLPNKCDLYVQIAAQTHVGLFTQVNVEEGGASVVYDGALIEDITAITVQHPAQIPQK